MINGTVCSNCGYIFLLDSDYDDMDRDLCLDCFNTNDNYYDPDYISSSLFD